MRVRKVNSNDIKIHDSVQVISTFLFYNKHRCTQTKVSDKVFRLCWKAIQ